MGNRSLFSLLVLIILVFVIVKIDLFTTVKAGVTNLIYGNEIVNMKGLRVSVEPLLADLEKEGLSRETIRRELSAAIEKAGVKSLAEAEWQRLPEKPTLSATISAAKVADRRYQYNVLIEVLKREPLDSGGYGSKDKTIWSSSGMGEGDVSDIRARITREMAFFLKAHEH